MRSRRSTRCWRASRAIFRRASTAPMRWSRSGGRTRRSPTTTRRSALVPNHPLALFNRGNALSRCSAASRRRLPPTTGRSRCAPQHVKAWQPRARARGAQPASDALASYDRALALQPDHADAHFNAALSLLTVGDYARGFAEYEWRWKRTGMARGRNFGKPPWLGEYPLARKTILLHAEQGLGDTDPVRALCAAARAGGATVVLEVPAGAEDAACGSRRRDGDRGARRNAAAVRCALSARQPAARLQDRRWRTCRPTFPICTRSEAAHRQMAAAARGAAVAARGARLVRQSEPHRTTAIDRSRSRSSSRCSRRRA